MTVLFNMLIDCSVSLPFTFDLGCTSVELTLSSPALDDAVLSGDSVEVCPTTTEVEFSCTAENVTELIWGRVRMNETDEIFHFHVRKEPPFNTPDGYTVYLDNSTIIDQLLLLFAPITSTLRVAKVSELIDGLIECRVFDNAEHINESLRVKLLGKF